MATRHKAPHLSHQACTKEGSHTLGFAGANRRTVVVVFNLVALLDNIAYLTSPVIPEASEKITDAIRWDGDTLSVKKIDSLFPRLAEDGESRRARLK